MDRNTLRLLEEIQKLKSFDSVTLQLMREAAAKIDLIQFNAFDEQQFYQLKQIEHLERAFSSIDLQRIQSQALEAIAGYEAFDKRFLANAQRSLELSLSTWNKIQLPYNFPAFVALTNALSREQDPHKSFLFDIAEKIQWFALEIEEDSQEKALTSIKESLIKKAKMLPNGVISFEGMFSILIALIALCYSILAHRSDTESAKQVHHDMQIQIQQIDKLSNELIPQFAKLLQDQSDSTWYAVERKSSMFSRASTKSSIIGTLYPNQRVQLIKRNHKWIYIEYFDYLDGVPKNGWVLKKYLNLIIN